MSHFGQYPDPRDDDMYGGPPYPYAYPEDAGYHPSEQPYHHAGGLGGYGPPPPPPPQMMPPNGYGDDGYNDDGPGVDDEDEMLRRAMEESLSLHNTAERDRDERERRMREAEEETLRASREEEDRRRREEAARQQEQEEMDRAAIVASQLAEGERRMRRREQLERMDREFGSGSASASASGMRPGTGTGDRRRRDEGDIPTSSRQSRLAGGAMDAIRETGRRRSRRQPMATETPTQGTSMTPDGQYPQGPQRRRREQQTQRPHPRRGSVPFTPRAPSPPQVPSSTDMPSATPFPTPGGSPPLHGGATTDPSSYNMEDILALSMQQSYSTAPFTEEGQESNHDELQRAINESAEQHRDEEAEAIERNRGVPTYEEACAAKPVRAPRGSRYTFQGPEKADKESNVEVVGDMDLGEAMKIANQKVKGKKDRRGK